MQKVELAKRLGAIEESATLALNARVKQMAADGQSVYNLTAGELACETPGYIQEAVALKLNQNKYTPTAGLPDLREAIARHASTFYGKEYEPKNVMAVAGAKPALFAVFLALLNPGDEVIVPVPMWVSYKHAIELAGAVAVEVPLTDEFDIDPAAVKAAITPRTKAIIINSPHNPTGAVYSSNGLSKLVEIIKATSITVVADDLYTKLVYVSDYQPITSFGFENLIIINGFSKSQALTGWRIGYIVADPSIIVAINQLASHILGNAPLPSQYAALAALEHDDAPAMFDVLRQQRDLVCNSLKTISSLRVQEPAGAFYVFIDIRNITRDSVSWCESLLADQGVALVPGEAFSAPGFARLSFVTDEQTLTEALKRIQLFVQQKGDAA